MHKTSRGTDISTARSSDLTAKTGLVAKVSDAASFWGVILLSAAALVAIAFVTPVVLAIAAVAGLVAGNKPHSSWRSSRA